MSVWKEKLACGMIRDRDDWGGMGIIGDRNGWGGRM